MKKYILLSIFFTVCFSINAQQLKGRAEYYSKIIIKKNASDAKVKSGEDAEIETKVQAAMKKASEKKYELLFNTSESYYDQIQELEKPETAAGEFSIKISLTTEGGKYTNLKNKTTVTQDEIFGKEFVVTDELQNFNWKLIDETKKIGEYTCYKAETIVPPTQEDKDNYELYLKRKSNNKTIGLFGETEEPKDKLVIAWYTLEIPVTFGPNKYWGLPGLILEIDEEQNIILCSKVVISSKDTTKIRVPNTGKKITKKEFEKLRKDKTESMQDENGIIMFQTGE